MRLGGSCRLDPVPQVTALPARRLPRCLRLILGTLAAVHLPSPQTGRQPNLRGVSLGYCAPGVATDRRMIEFTDCHWARDVDGHTDRWPLSAWSPNRPTLSM
jgi:hypothetical protein